MFLVRKEKRFRKTSESGFVLLAALFGVLILLAVGYFALTVSTRDLQIASRLVSERKAFYAAESGVHVLCLALNPKNPAAVNAAYVDSENDPTSKYSYAVPVRNEATPDVLISGFDLALAYKGAHYDTVVTGEDTTYGSKVEIAVGTASAPNPADTQQGTN